MSATGEVAGGGAKDPLPPLRIPVASSESARRTMVGNRHRDTKVELAVRRRLHRAGLRYRVDFAPDPSDRRRRADIVFTRARVAVYLDGCYWHGCPVHYAEPRTNVDYWRPKIARNRARDLETTQRLRALGWTVLRFWEHEDPDDVSTAILRAVRPEDTVVGKADAAP